MLDAAIAYEITRQLATQDGEFADAYFESTRKRTFVHEDGRLQNLSEGCERGVGLRLIRDLKSCYGYTNAITRHELLKLAQGIASQDTANALDKNIALKRQVTKIELPVRSDPFKIEISEQASLIDRLASRATTADPRIRQVRLSLTLVHQDLRIVNSLAQWIDTTRTYTILSVLVTAADGSRLFTGHESMGGHAGQEILDEQALHPVVDAAVRRAVNQITAKPAPSGRCCVVLAGKAGGTFIHEAVGHGLEADLACEDQSVFSDKMGALVAAPFITVTDGATRPGALGSFAFDDEGTPAQKTTLIKNGVLQNFLYDRLSAMKYGGTPTGNGRRESYEYRPIVRMTNTLLENGLDDAAAILKSVDRGIYVTKMGGGQVNTVNGDFVFEAEEAYLIENGETSTPVRGATLVGNALDVLKSIDRLGNDIGYSIGYCGKDGQSVPISDGLPTLRIPEIVIGGTGAG